MAEDSRGGPVSPTMGKFIEQINYQEIDEGEVLQYNLEYIFDILEFNSDLSWHLIFLVNV